MYFFAWERDYFYSFRNESGLFLIIHHHECPLLSKLRILHFRKPGSRVITNVLNRHLTFFLKDTPFISALKRGKSLSKVRK